MRHTYTTAHTHPSHTTETAAAASAGKEEKSNGDEKKGKEKKTRVEFVPVEWFDAIRSDEDSLTRKVCCCAASLFIIELLAASVCVYVRVGQ